MHIQFWLKNLKKEATRKT